MHWPTDRLLAAPWQEWLLVLVAVVCGGIVGTERERSDKPAGLRTLILVCVGSTVFTIVSYSFTTSTGDSGRVAAQIVTGVGFLGAGAILHSRISVSGMTTAATIWIMAAIGIMIGVGRPLMGFGLALLVRGVLVGVRRWEIRHLGGLLSATVEVVFDPDYGKTQIRIQCALEEFHVRAPLEIEPGPADGVRLTRLRLQLPRRQFHELLGEIAGIPAVREIREHQG